MNTARGHISPYGWVMISMLLGLGVINFADRAVLGLAAVSIIKELHLSPAQYGLVGQLPTPVRFKQPCGSSEPSECAGGRHKQ